eukprot:gene16134-7495_t
MTAQKVLQLFLEHDSNCTLFQQVLPGEDPGPSVSYKTSLNIAPDVDELEEIGNFEIGQRIPSKLFIDLVDNTDDNLLTYCLKRNVVDQNKLIKSYATRWLDRDNGHQKIITAYVRACQDRTFLQSQNLPNNFTHVVIGGNCGISDSYSVDGIGNLYLSTYDYSRYHP